MKHFFLFGLSLFLLSCQDTDPTTFHHLLQDQPAISGETAYLKTPYVTAGDRVYAVGHQDGTFPDLGWHVKGEMGGIWNHPIKLMDGFAFGLSTGERYYCLDDATAFINYPMANQHFFALDNGLEIVRTQFVPDQKEGMIVEFILQNRGDVAFDLTIDFTGMIDLSPVWLAERKDIVNGQDLASFNMEEGYWIANDSLNSWFTVLGTDRQVSGFQEPYADCSWKRKGLGKDLMLQTEITLSGGEQKSIRYFIAGSYTSSSEAIKTLKELQKNPEELLSEKISRYQQIRQTAQLTIPDKGVQQMYTWTKYNTDWLIREVPELGRGLSAGIPDYPWWFGTDNTYSLQGWLATGQHEEVKSTLELIVKLSRQVNDNGRIMHEASTNGVVFNPGNLNTTPYFTHLLWKYFEWTGDQDFLESLYPDVKKGLKWLEDQDKDGNGYPDGAGMMEIPGLHTEMIDVVSYSYAAYKAAAKMAALFNDPDLQQTYQQKSEWLAEKINSDWWVERAGSFADFRASRAKTLQLIEEAMVRADTIDKPWAVEELKSLKAQTGRLRDNRVQGHVVHHNWVVNTPLEVGVATPQHALQALETARQYTNRFGMYVTGIDRDENQEESSKWKAFSYVGAVMTLPTGVQAISEARYGRPDRALEYLKMLENGFSYALPGSMYEVSPDYGMIAQAWNIYAVATPIIEYLFGIRPKAYEQQVTIQPNLPSDWGEAKLENLRIGDNALDLEKITNGYVIRQSQPEWKVILILDDTSRTITINDENVAVSPDENGLITLELTGAKSVVEISSQ